MATNIGLKFFKLNSDNVNFTTALGTNGSIVYVPDKHEVWVGGNNANAAKCVVKGASNVTFANNVLTITSKELKNGVWTEVEQTLDFSDVPSSSATLKVFNNVYNLIGTTPIAGVQTLDYSNTHYLDGADSGEDSSEAANSLVEADRILDEKIWELGQYIGPGGSVVNKFGGKSGIITIGNGLTMGTGASEKEVSVKVNGYIVNNAGTGGNALDIDSSKVDSNYTIANTTNLATVATVAAALNTLDVTGYAQGSIASASGDSTSVITINGIKEEDGKIAKDTTTDVTINVDGVYNASTNMIATKSTVTNAIDSLDVNNITGFGAGKTLATLTETDGKIAATFQDISITSSQISDLSNTYSSTGTVAVTGTAVAKAIETLDTQSDVTISGLSGTTLTINGVKEVDGIISATASPQVTLEFKSAPTTGDNANKIITEADLSGIVGAMVYKGAVNSNSDLPTSNITAGWTYVVATAGTYAGKACEVGDVIIAKVTKESGVTADDWNIINGENQVTNGNVTMVAGNGSAYTLATVDGTDITAKVNVTAGSATIATVADGVVTITPTVSQAANTGTIQAASGTNIVFAKAATTGAAADVSIADSGEKFTATNVEGALAELKGDIEGLDATVATYTTSGTTVTYTGTNNVAVTVTEANGKLTEVNAHLYWEVYEENYIPVGS